MKKLIGRPTPVYAPVLALVFALTLAACGGGGEAPADAGAPDRSGESAGSGSVVGVWVWNTESDGDIEKINCEFKPGGTFVIRIGDQDSADVPDGQTGTYSVSGDKLTMTYYPAPDDPLEYTVSGDTIVRDDGVVILTKE